MIDSVMMNCSAQNRQDVKPQKQMERAYGD